jgi:hypothetical protein
VGRHDDDARSNLRGENCVGAPPSVRELSKARGRCRIEETYMTKSMPPVPPENHNPNDLDGKPPANSAPDLKKAERERNLEQQGRQGNIKQNTTNQGHQQDR